MTEALIDHHPNHHPIGLVVEDDLKRNRLTVFFRLLLAIPQLIWVYFYGWIAGIVAFVAWLVAIFTGRVPEPLHDFLARYQRVSTHVNAYVLLLADPWPPFGGTEGSYPIDLRVDPPVQQSRVTVLFRLVLAIPAFLLASVFRIVNTLVAFLGWFYALATGRMHEGMRDVSAWMFQYELQTWCYAFLLTDRYPSLSGGPTA
jgi:Domain of unknown function (DUF4389)